MILLKLFYNFLIVGLFSFGGAYATIPLIRDVARNFGMFSEEYIADFIAIAESTPGPIAVNLATYVGTSVGGAFGAVIATFAETLPAFIIMLVFSIYFKDIFKNKKVNFVFLIVKPCIIGIIMSAGLYMLFQNIGLLKLITNSYRIDDSIKAIIIFFLILIAYKLYNKFTNKKLGAISTIIIGAIFGIAINAFV